MKNRFLLPSLLFLAPYTEGKEGKDGLVDESEAVEHETTSWGSEFCDWWEDDPGELYRNKKNPWIQQVKVSGRFHYQLGRVQGNDARGNSFDNNFDEFRRARVAVEVDFLKYFEVEVGVNLVDDRRFRADPNNSLRWGFDDFDTIAIEFNLGKALGKGPFDEIKMTYGSMKLRVSEEVHTSSNNLKTIERGSLSDILGGNQSRPTGFTIELEKDDWSTVLGIFSNEDSSDSLADWDEGVFYYGHLEWQVTDEWRIQVDHAQGNPNRTSDALGYNHGTSLAFIYESDRWGITTDLIYGQNSDDEDRDPLREGDFYGGLITPWVWLVEDRLELVGRYEYARAEESEGIRLQARYARELHNPPAVDLDNGYGDELHSFYVGLNWHLCDGGLKVMGGISQDLLSTRTGDVSATSYLFALRTWF